MTFLFLHHKITLTFKKRKAPAWKSSGERLPDHAGKYFPEDTGGGAGGMVRGPHKKRGRRIKNLNN
jgi:hypothetical protein